jgi:FkbM family methyltransferase
MIDLAQRIAALPPEKLALLERRLSKHLGQTGNAAPPSTGGNGPARLADASTESADRPPDLKLIEQVLGEHPASQQVAAVFTPRGNDRHRVVAYIVPDQERARPVLQILQMESEGRLSGRPRYELPNGMTVVHLNRSETEYVYREIFQEQSYLRHGVSLPDGACVFDVGAHIGLFTLFVSQMSPGAEVYAFEPLPPTFDALQLNVFIHGVNAKVFEFGLSDKEGAASFSYYPHASVLSGRYADAAEERQTIKATLRTQQQLGVRELALSDEGIDELLQATLIAERFECPVKTLSQVIRENGLEKIDLLKIDVEKSEHDVLVGIDEGDWPKIRQIVVEVHDLDGRLDRVARLLEGHGFELAVEQDAILRETSIYNIYAVRPAETEAAPVEAAARAVPAPGWGWSSPERLIQEVRQFASGRLPEHLRPDALVLLRALPMKPNGEVDYSALPSPERPPSVTKGTFVAPRTATEQKLAELWAAVLRLEKIGINDNFFGLGGDWAQATQMISRVHQLFGVEFSPRDMPEDATVANLALIIARRETGRHVDHNVAAISPNGHYESDGLREVDRFSDEDVNSFLSHLDTVEAAAEPPPAVGTVPSAAPELAAPEAYDANTITRIVHGEQYDLLTNLNLLFDEEVDLLLTNMFTETEIADGLSAIRVPTPTLDRGTPVGARTPDAYDFQTRTIPGGFREDGLASIRPAGADVARLLEQAYLTYTRMLQEIGLESQWKSAEAHHAYAWDTREILMRGGDQSLHDEASQNYALSLEEARTHSQRRFETAYLNYLEEVREIWVRMDVAAVVPGSLEAISRGMAMAANLAAGTLGGSRA